MNLARLREADDVTVSAPGFADPGPGLASALARCAREPLRAIDVGSRGGLHPLLMPVAPITEIVGFEPDVYECERLNRQVAAEPWLSATVLPCAVTGQTGERVLHVTGRPDLSSLLPPTHAGGSADWEIVERRIVPGRSFADLRHSGVLHGRWDFLKVDVQGLEHEVLSSVPPAIELTLAGIQVECRVQRHYRGQRSLLEVMEHVGARGFELFALDQVFAGGSAADLRQPWPPSRRALSHADLLFLRDPCWPDAAQDPEERCLRASRLVVLYGLHGYWLAALDVADRHLPEHAAELRRLLPRSEDTPRWRLRLLAMALACAVRAGRPRRFRLARHALLVEGGGIDWRLSVPRL